MGQQLLEGREKLPRAKMELTMHTATHPGTKLLQGEKAMCVGRKTMPCKQHENTYVCV